MELVETSPHTWTPHQHTQVPVESIRGDLSALGLEESVVLRLLEVIKSKDIAALEAEIGKDSPVCACVRAWAFL